MGLASVVLAICGGGAPPAHRELVLQRNGERNAHDRSHRTTGRQRRREVIFEMVSQTVRENFNTTIRSQNTWIPVTTTSTIVLTPTADPPGQIGGTGHYNSPRGRRGDFVTTGNATASTIDATFDGIDCEDGSGIRLPFSGRIRVTKSVAVRIQVAGTCEGEDRCLRHRQG